MSANGKRPDQIQKMTSLELEITDLAYGGKGIGKIEDFVVFVGGAVPGDLVRARITKRQKNFAEAVMEEILRPSPDRIEPHCPLSGECGGCSWQNLPYKVQLAHKQSQAEATLEHLGKARPDCLRPIVPSPDEWRYRNKMDFTFGANEDGWPVIGFHRPGQFWRILEVHACLLQPEPMDHILGAMTRWVREKGLKAYSQKTHEGFLRHLIVRHSVTTDEYIAMLETHRGVLPDREGLIAALREACPRLKGFAWGLNTGLADVARQEEELWRWGEPELIETLGGLRFRVSPQSFFQVNTRAAERLYTVVRDLLGDDARGTRLLDAYCGTGTIGLYCADRVAEVVGVEVVRDAVWDARENADRNGIGNCTFLAGDMSETLPLVVQMPGGPFGRVIMDPPRGGMDKRSLRGLLAMGAPVLIYVSCNPGTLARDLQIISEAGYRPTVMQPVDLFPQTYHIETVLRFEKKDEG